MVVNGSSSTPNSVNTATPFSSTIRLLPGCWDCPLVAVRSTVQSPMASSMVIEATWVTVPGVTRNPVA